MDTNHANHRSSPTATRSASGSVDPELVLAVRSALVALLAEQHVGSAAPTAESEAAKKAGPRWTWLDQHFWENLGAVALAAVAITGVIIYMQLTADYGQSREELSKLRRELGLVRGEVVRKDTFKDRALSANALLQDAKGVSKANADTGAQRIPEQRQSVADLQLLLKDLDREMERLQERLRTLEKRR